MTSKPHDALFKAAFESPRHAAGVFRTVLPAALRDAIAWDTVSREAGSFIDPDLADRHSDLLFSVELDGRLGGARAFLYLLLEHQSSNDHDMPLRMLVYLVRIWERFRKHQAGPLPLVIPVLISHAPAGWTAPTSFHELFEPAPSSIPGLAQLVPSFSLLVDDLVRLDNQQLRRRALAAFPTLALWVLRDARDGPTLLANLQVWAATFREALRTPHGLEAVAQVLRYVALVAGDMRFSEFRATIIHEVPQATEVAMTIAEELRQEGLVKGRTEILVKQMTLKFGELSAAHLKLIETATEAQIERYAERVLTATSVEAVLARD